MIEVSPSSSAAFAILYESCASRGLNAEYVIGLATVLMLPSRNAPPPKLVPPVMLPGSVIPSKKGHLISERLFESIDRCMAISSTQDALDSLLCSAFFNPCIPCNLVGALSLAITEALLPVDTDYRGFITAVANKAPHLTPFWVAILLNGQAMPLLAMTLKDLPPVCLIAAFWTNTVQSFLQVTYNPDHSTETSVPRSSEFSISYFCRSEVSVPWSPAPPFGSTGTSNLSLEIKEHYGHKHRPLWWCSYWVLRSEERVPASSQIWLKAPPAQFLLHGPDADPKSRRRYVLNRISLRGF